MLISKVRRYHREIVRRTQTVSEVSGESVLSIGQALSQVMSGALSIDQRMGGLTIDESRDASVDASGMRDALLEPLSESARLTESASTIVARVGTACDELTHITSMCQILLMHTRIETDRMQETGIVATSEQLSSFTAQIVSATSQAESVQQDLACLVDDLDRNLPAMRKVLESLHQGVRTRQFRHHQNHAVASERLTTAVRSIKAHAQEIVSLSRDGVTALQFQDPAAQALQRLDSKFTELMLVHLGYDEPLKWGRRLGDPTSNLDGTDAEALRVGVHVVRDHIVRRADGFIRDADKAVVVIREIIPSIVELVESQARASEKAVANARVTDEITPFLNRTVAELDKLTKRYVAIASSGQELCSRIVDVQQTIASVAHRVEAPAQNLSLQASKAGKHGRPLAVIADEVVAMSRRTAQVGQRVVQAANALLELLPVLEEKARYIANEVHAKASEIRDTLADSSSEASQRANNLRKALSDVQDLARKVRHAEQSIHIHYGFADELRPVLLAMKAAAADLTQEVVSSLGKPSGEVPDESVQADGRIHWMTETTEAAEVEVGELILL